MLVLWSLAQNTSSYHASILACALGLVAAGCLSVLSHLQHTRTIRPSSIINSYLFFSIIFDVVQARTLWLRPSTPVAISCVFSGALATKLAMAYLEAKEKRPILEPFDVKPSPESTASLYNRSVFWWLNQLFLTGFRNTLTMNDLYPLPPDMASALLRDRLARTWSRISSRHSIDLVDDRGYLLLRAAASALKWPLFAPVVGRLALMGFKYSQPFLLSTTVDYVQQDSASRPKNVGYGLMAATALVYLGIALSTGFYNYHVFRATTLLRGALVSTIYRKTLSLNLVDAKAAAALTLSTTDVDRIGLTLKSAHEIWASSIEAILAVILLQRQLGWACIAPVTLALLATAANAAIGRHIPGRQREWGAAIQKRVTLTSSALRNMKGVKMMGLVDIVSDMVQRARVHDLDRSKRYRSFFAYMSMVSTLPVQLSAPLAFLLYILGVQAHSSSHSLVAAQVFASLSLVELLTTPLQEVLSSIPTFLASLGSFGRIQSYLLLKPHVDHRQTILPPTPAAPARDEGVVSFRAATFPVGMDGEHVLRITNLTCEVGSLTMVIGPVGSGKTTLMDALLGEMQPSGGLVRSANCSIAYCKQEPWIINGTILENIVGPSGQRVLDEAWYRTVLWSCALDKDVEEMPGGDYTPVGSRGVSLSGGQKQRLALARAVYARESVVALDDILSALDARTEKLVFERLLSKDGLLRQLGATIVLATHAVHRLASADQIVVLDQSGQVVQVGTFEDLGSCDGYVRKIMADTPDHGGERGQDGLQVESSVEVVGDRPQALPAAEAEVIVAPSASAAGKPIKEKQASESAVLVYYYQSIGWYRALLFLLLTLACVFCTKFPQVWAGWWADTTSPNNGSFLGVYFALALLAVATNAVAIWTMMIVIVPISAAKLHRHLLDAVMHAPMSFFAATDSGTTLNRFSQDMSLINSRLPVSVLQATSAASLCLAQLILVATGSTYFAAFIPFTLVVIWMLQKFYLHTSRQLRLLDLEQKSPLLSSIFETLEGLSSVRAFGWVDDFERRNLQRLDESQRPFYMLYCIQRWLNLILDLIVAALAVLLVTLGTQIPSSTSGVSLGVAMLNVLGFSQSLSQFVYNYTDMETSLQAVARVKNFVDTVTPEDLPNETRELPKEWPVRGAVEFHNVTASYDNQTTTNNTNTSISISPALDNISFTIPPGQKVGICGRTGSGKSTLLATLFRTVDLSQGRILIDDIDIATVPRRELRARMVAVPQDPVFLPGTVRSNASPFASNSSPDDDGVGCEAASHATATTADGAIIAALEAVGLWPSPVRDRGGLDADMEAVALSHGQQQMFSLARAALRVDGIPGAVVVLDEPSSNVDGVTNGVMEGVIRDRFSKNTVVTVAHRLSTIVDCDLVVVLERGSVVEMGQPGDLFAHKGAFWDLCRAQGVRPKIE